MTTINLELPEPLDHQREILSAQARFVVVCAGRRVGKTETGKLALLLGWGRVKGALAGGRTWYVAPTYPMATGVWRDLRALCHGVATHISETSRRIEFHGGGSIEVKSADDPDRLRGAGLDLVVVDEAAHIDGVGERVKMSQGVMSRAENLWNAVLRPALSDRKGGAMFLSTPCGTDAWFHKIWMRAEREPEWVRFHRPSSDNPLMTQAELDVAHREVGSLVFAQEYLAEFVVPGGADFRREWFRYQDPPPLDQLVRFACVDLAASIKQTADYTAIVVMGMRSDGMLFLLDVVRQRLEGPAITPTIKAACERWKLSFVGIEKVGFQLALVQIARAAGVPVRELEADKDKRARALAATAFFEAGKIAFPRFAPWLPAFESELLSFPNGAHDDQVDALAYAVRMASSLVSMFDPVTPARPKPIVPWRGLAKPEGWA